MKMEATFIILHKLKNRHSDILKTTTEHIQTLKDFS